jgi:DNA-directed RNA polymerase III subunit RPC1
MPKDLDPSMCNIDGYLIIRNSEIMSGVIDKSVIGDGSKKSLFYTALCDYGPVAAAECMNRIAKLSARWLANQGFSIGIDDVQPGVELTSKKEAAIAKAYQECDKLIQDAKDGVLAIQPGFTLEQTLEV